MVFLVKSQLKKWVLDLASQAETFFWRFIETRITIDDIDKGIPSQCRKILKETLEMEKYILPSTLIIGETNFTSMDFIGGKLFSNHPNNLNHIHKDSKDLISVIITVVKYIRRGDTVFYNGVKTSDLESRARVLKNLHGRMIFCPLKKSMKVLFGEDIDQ